MFRTTPLRCLLSVAVLSCATLGATAGDSLSPLATRSLMLTGGGRVEVGTRYNLVGYRTGQMIRIDPVLSATSPHGTPEIVAGSVELRPHGFAPCLGSDADAEAGCVQGTQPSLEPGGNPSTFRFSFVRLFNTADADGTASPAWFGYASFLVTLKVRAADGSEETVRFPLTVTVQQTEVRLEPVQLPVMPSLTQSPRPDAYRHPLTSYPPLRDRLTSPDPLD